MSEEPTLTTEETQMVMTILQRLPRGVQEQMMQASSFQDKHWAEIVPDWGPFWDTLLVFSRSRGQQERWQSMSDDENPLALLYGDAVPQEIDDVGTDRAVALFCLPDSVLDCVLKHMDVQAVVAGLSPELQEDVRGKLGPYENS